jgi:hypothetical protein
VSVGPIWSSQDAQNRCAPACSSRGMAWQGEWRTVRAGVEAVCGCNPGGFPGPYSPAPSAMGPGGSCRARSVRQCEGCSISCRPGQTAYCEEGSVGIFTRPDDTLCSRHAKCECR